MTQAAASDSDSMPTSEGFSDLGIHGTRDAGILRDSACRFTLVPGGAEGHALELEAQLKLERQLPPGNAF